MARLKLSPPWDEYYRKVNALFSLDPDIHILYDEEDYILKLFVNDDDKAAALKTLLPETVNFGNINLTVEIIPANGCGRVVGIEDAIRIAFDGNPIVNGIYTTSGMGTFNATYVLFKKEVVQYFNDSLADIHGYRSTLYEDIAREVLGTDIGVYFCTDIL